MREEENWIRKGKKICYPGACIRPMMMYFLSQVDRNLEEKERKQRMNDVHGQNWTWMVILLKEINKYYMALFNSLWPPNRQKMWKCSSRKKFVDFFSIEKFDEFYLWNCFFFRTKISSFFMRTISSIYSHWSIDDANKIIRIFCLSIWSKRKLLFLRSNEIINFFRPNNRSISF